MIFVLHDYLEFLSVKLIHCVKLIHYILLPLKSGCHASIVLQVTEQTSRQISHFRRGLTETGIWPLLTQRRDVIPVLFPRESDAQVTPQVPCKNVQDIFKKNGFSVTELPRNLEFTVIIQEMTQFQMILDCVIWPSSITVFLEKYDEDYLSRDEFCGTDIKRVSSFLKTFIENGRYESCGCL